MDPDAPPRPPSLTEYGPEIRVLAGIHNRLGELIRTTRAAAGEKNPPKLPHYPAPVLAVERVRRRNRMEKREQVKRMLLPHS